MSAVRDYGTPLVEDPGRVEQVASLGIDETAFLKANVEHPTMYVTGLVDLERRVLIDMIEGNRAIDVSRWLSSKDEAFLAGIATVACDLHEGYRSGLHPHLDHARQVADPFHVVAAANRCVDHVRRRVQNELLGHRGRKDDPLYKIRRVLLTGSERLNQRGVDRMALGLRLGDPDDEVLGAWLAKEYLRDVYLTDDPDEAAVLLDRVIAGCLTDEVDEIVSLGNTLKHWRTQILAHHLTGASNGPTEAMNLLVKKIKRCGHGFKSFRNYRLRVLLHCGGIQLECSSGYDNAGPLAPVGRVEPLYLQGVGHVKLNVHRPLRGRPKTLTIRRRARHLEATVFCTGVPRAELAPTGKAIGRRGLS
jgi:transposase